MMLDLRILVRTLGAVISSRGAN